MDQCGATGGSRPAPAEEWLRSVPAPGAERQGLSLGRGDIIDVVNLSELDPGWNWLASSSQLAGGMRWVHSSAKSVDLPVWVPRPATLRRAVAGWRAAGLLPQGNSILVSHGPRMTMYGALAMAARRKPQRHLAYSFNFTELPHGAARRVMAAAFQRVDRFVCFSTMERQLYARHFDLDVARIDMIHWAAEPPVVDHETPPIVAGDYICALGSQARDYATLVAAMRTLPRIKLAIVATPASVAGLELPGNVELLCDIPVASAMNVLQHARFSVVPLTSSEVPCGHVTIVSSMHAGKATIVTASSGVADYIEDGINGLTVPPGDPTLLARAIERLWGDPAEAARQAQAAREFAQGRCREQAAVDYFRSYLRQIGL